MRPTKVARTRRVIVAVKLVANHLRVPSRHASDARVHAPVRLFDGVVRATDAREGEDEGEDERGRFLLRRRRHRARGNEGRRDAGGAFDARGRFFRDGSPPPKKCDAIREARLRARVVSGVTKKRLKIRMGAKEMRSLPSLLLGGGLFLSPRTVFFLVVVVGGG